MKTINILICVVSVLPWGVNCFFYCFLYEQFNTCSLMCKSNNNVNSDTGSTQCEPSEVNMTSCKLLILDLDEGKKFKNISVIRADKNYIRQIYAHTFEGFNLVQKLYLSENILMFIHPFAFSHLKNLIYLDLTKNFLISYNPHLILSANKLGLSLLIGNNYHTSNTFDDTYQNTYELEKHKEILRLKVQNPATVLLKQLPTFNLVAVDISNNDMIIIFEDTFKNQDNLKTINMESNKLTNLPDGLFSGLIILDSLNIRHNYITTLTENIFSSNEKLYSIDLSNNRLEFIHEFTFLNLKSLHLLNLKDNNLQNINHNWFIFNGNLNHLDMSENYIYNMPVDILRRNTNLKSLRLDDNHFTTVEFDHFKTLSSVRLISMKNVKLAYLKDKLFYGCKILMTVDLRNNDLISVNENMFMVKNRIKLMLLSNNKIKQISNIFFSKIPRLEYLRLDHNQIENINDMFGSISKLMYLNVSHNILSNISSKSFASNVHLMHIDLSHNYISNLAKDAFSELNKLLTLNLASNNLKTLPYLSNNFKLKALDLSNNQLTMISEVYKNKTSLLSFFVSDNMLQQFPIEIFKEAPKLKRLNFNKNFIQFFIMPPFYPKTELIEIMASCNNFTVINNKTFTSLDINTKVFLHGNPINCNCMNLNVNINKERFSDGILPICIMSHIKKCEDNLTDKLLDEWKLRLSQSPNVCDSTMWKKYDFEMYLPDKEYNYREINYPYI